MKVHKSYESAYNDIRTFAVASQAGAEAVAKLGSGGVGAEGVGSLRNSEDVAAVVGVVHEGDSFDIVHVSGGVLESDVNPRRASTREKPTGAD
mgnify:CR=1 FL=1